MNRFRIIATVAILISLSAMAQEEGKKKLENDFEKYKQQHAYDFQNFKQRREAELQKMEQDYLNYYNQMIVLKSEFVKTGEPEKAQTVQEMIDYENTISKTLGYRIPERIKEMPNVEGAKVNAAKQQNEEIIEDDRNNGKAAEPPTTTFKSDVNSPDGITMLIPLPKNLAKITSPFGIRIHPTLGRPIKHNGVDFGSGRGAEVYAASNGVVVLAQHNKTYGNYVIVKHNDDISSVYAHLDKIIVSKGYAVKKGDVIGYTGSTGRTSGPHLHYEIRIKGIPVDPKGYLVETKK